MRRTALVLTAIAALTACNPSAPSAPAGGLFPDLSGSAYRAEALVTGQDGQASPMVMIRDGGRMRMEFASAQGHMIIVNTGTESFMITQQGGRAIAMRTDGGMQQDLTAQWQAELAATATHTGSCSGAGMSGAEWSSNADGVARTTCVTDNGVILRATENGRTTWETTSVQVGPQDPNLFVLPPGVQVMDLGNMAGMTEALEAAKQGRQ